MHATPTSNRKRKKNIIKVTPAIRGALDKTQIAVDRRYISRCPAVRLAASRSPSAMGCANSLMVSIITIRGMRYEGVPWGTRWLSRFLNAK